VVEQGSAVSRQINGQVPDNPVGERRDKQGLRLMDVELGRVQADHLQPGFTLVVKHNALFTALIDRLPYPCFAVVRNPLAVLASWNSVNLPVHHGRIPAAEKYDPALQRQLQAIDDRLQRQLRILEWFQTRFRLWIPAENILRYETFVGDPCSITHALGLANPVSSPRDSRNRTYDPEILTRVFTLLMQSDRDIWQFYTPADIAALYTAALP
jgi:hypothetical protein